VVLGPAVDGGYYLIGFSSLKPSVFSDVAWGTCNVYAQTVRNLETNSTSWSRLRVIHDLDTFEDLVLLWNEMRNQELLELRDRELFECIDTLVENRDGSNPKRID